MSAAREAVDAAAFRELLVARGCAPIGEVEWPPGRVSPEHVHDFTAVGLVLAGGFTLRTAAGARRLLSGRLPAHG
jgi:quercetin dioxygenase-like cupin family protein